MKDHIPAQHTGGQVDAVATASFPTQAEAIDFYHLAKSRLLNVHQWGQICQVPLSTFILTDPQGNPVTREAEAGDFIKIDIPGPGTHSGDSYDWVKIESILEEFDIDTAVITLQARPVPNPLRDDAEVAHFYTAAATSSFQVKRISTTVSAEEHGRNEVPNTDTSYLTDNIRNTLIGWTAKIGLSFPQWKSLVKGIVDTAG